MKYLQNYTCFTTNSIFSTKKISENLMYHIENNISIENSIFRYGSDSFISLIREVKELSNNKEINLTKNDLSIINDIEFFNDEVYGIIFIDENFDINEAEYKGRKVVLNKPKRGGIKKFYVYVKNPESGEVIKVSFGAKDGGHDLSVKLKDSEAKKNFAQRHDCENKNDKTKPSYWSCRLPRYAKLLGLAGSGKWW